MEDRQVTAFDEKQRVLDLTTFKFEPPSVGIYDEPVRCYKANVQWAKIIEGLLDWLTEIAAWKQAENENYIGIQEMLKFIEGIECTMTPIDCEQVENCLETSETIQNIKTIQDNGYNAANATKPINQGVNSAAFSQAIYAPQSACDIADKDALWSSVSAFVDYWHSRNLQLLNEFSGVGGLQQAINILIEQMPLYSVLSSSIKSNFAQWLISQAASAYEAQVTTSVLNEIKCELFCLAVANGCTQTLEQLVNQVFTGLFAWNLSSDITNLFTELSTFAGLDGQEWFAAIGSLQISLAALGEKSVSTVGLQSFLDAARAGSASASGEWEALCTDCSAITRSVIVYDFKGNYAPQSGEIVYRPPFNINLGGGSAGNKANVVYGTGLILGSSNTNRFYIPFSNTVNPLAVQYRAKQNLAAAGRLQFEIYTSGTNVPASIYVPTSSMADSPIINASHTTSGLAMENISNAGGTWEITIEWIKWSMNTTQGLPKLA